MTQDALQSATFIDVKPSNNPHKVDVQTDESKLAEICYSPAHNAFVALNKTDLELLESGSAPFNQAMQNLVQAQDALATNPNSQAAQSNAKDAAEEMKSLIKGSGGSGIRWIEFHRVHSSTDILYAPGTIINPRDSSKNRKFYFLTSDSENADNAFKDYHEIDGTVNKSKFKQAFLETSASIKRDWNLVDESGQVPSGVIVGAFSEELASLLSDELELLDSWIDDVNKALSWQRQTFAEKKAEALKLLEHSESTPVTFERFGKAQLLCRQVWKDSSPIQYTAYADFDPSKKANQSNYNNTINDLDSAEIPPASWTASADANFMRWSFNAKAGIEFDLKKGKLAAEAKAEFDFALAEAKLGGAVFYPHDQGIQAKCTLPTRTKKQLWRPFIGSIDQRIYFDVDSDFLYLEDVQNLANAFRHWDTLKLTVNNTYRMTVIGHASLTGSRDHNQRLSSRRAFMTYGFITRNSDIWLSMFNRGFWNDDHRNAMRNAIHDNTSMPVSSYIRLQSISDKELIEEYFKFCERYFSGMNIHLPELVPAEFAAGYLIAKGELEPLIDTEQEEQLNRRVEFVLLEAGDIIEADGTADADFGHFRFKFEGHIGAWAGVNAGISGKVEVDCSHGQMKFADRLGASANAEAFAGAKVEAGLAGSLDWKSAYASNAKFEVLGSVGYLIQGQAGIGAQGEFAIGYDDDLGRFIFKAKASLCYGLGAGGKVEFSVDAEQVWAFIKLVYEQLRTADFSFVDVFENRVYERFCRWSQKLIDHGLWFQGLALRGGVEVANHAVRLGEAIGESFETFQEDVDQSIALHDLIDHMKANPHELIYAPPEVKGRILYRLLNDPSSITRDHGWTGIFFDVDKNREEAIVLLFTQGVVSKREYLEVLEHTLPESRSGRTELEKSRWVSHVQPQLNSYINDDEDRDPLRDWWDQLADPSGYSSNAINPFV